MRYLRNKSDGTIYEWHPVLARDAMCEEVTAEEAFPSATPKATKATKTVKAIQPVEAPPVSTVDNVALSEDASRGLP